MISTIHEEIDIATTTATLDTEDDGAIRLRATCKTGAYVELTVRIDPKYGPRFTVASASAGMSGFREHTAMAVAWAMARRWEFRVALSGDGFMGFV